MTTPNPDQPERCPSIDPHGELQCGRRIHEDDQCQFGGIAWKKGTPRYVSDHEPLAIAEAKSEEPMADLLAVLTVAVQDELDREANAEAIAQSVLTAAVTMLLDNLADQVEACLAPPAEVARSSRGLADE